MRWIHGGLGLALAGAVGAAPLAYKALNKPDVPPPVEYGVPWSKLSDHPMGNLSSNSKNGLQDAKNLVYAYRFGGEPKVNEVLAEVLRGQLEAGRLEQGGVYLGEFANALGLPALHGPAIRLKEGAVQRKPEDMDLMRSLATSYLNNGQAELSAQVHHLVVQRSPVKVERDHANVLFGLAICLAKRGMMTLANELFSLPEVQAMDDVSWQGFIDRYRFGKALVGFRYGERRDGALPYVEVVEVQKDSPAAVAGLAAGDRIEKISGARVTQQEQVRDRIEAQPLDSPFDVIVRRDGSFETLELIRSQDPGMVLARKLTAEGADLGSRGDLAGAAQKFDRARQVGPGYAKAWYNTAQLAQAQGNGPRALECTLAALALGLDAKLSQAARKQADELTLRLGGNAAFAFPPAVQQRSQLATLLGQQGEHVKAYLNFLEVLRESPGYGGALLGVAFLEQALGLSDQAKGHLQSFLRAYPNAPNRFAVEQTMRDLGSPVTRIAGGAAAPPGRPSFATPMAAPGAASGGAPAWGAAPRAPPTGQAQWGGAGFAPMGGGLGGGVPASRPPPATGPSWGRR